MLIRNIKVDMHDTSYVVHVEDELRKGFNIFAVVPQVSKEYGTHGTIHFLQSFIGSTKEIMRDVLVEWQRMDNKSYVEIYQPIAGFKSQLIYFDKEDDMYEPENTSYFGYPTYVEAIPDCVSWALGEELITIIFNDKYEWRTKWAKIKK
jgi:hypothetical protein